MSSSAAIAHCLDITTLDEASDTTEKVERLAKEALAIKAAAVCVFTKFVPCARKILEGSDVAVATVVNFPHGKDNIKAAEVEVDEAIKAGAQEVDFVFPYTRWMKGDDDSKQHVTEFVERIISQCKQANVRTKVILETGVLTDESQLREAIRLCIDKGVDYLKTSTGKVSIGARPREVKIILEEIQNAVKQGKGRVGLKLSGGIRTMDDVRIFLDLGEEYNMSLVEDGPKYFRIGASKLHQNLK